MARLWTARLMLLYSMSTALLLVLSLPIPPQTTVQRWNLFIFLVVLGACLASFVLLRRRPRIGWRIAGALGLLGVVLLCLNVRTIPLIAQGDGTAHALSAAIPLTVWLALAIAGACSLGRGPYLSRPESALIE